MSKPVLVYYTLYFPLTEYDPYVGPEIHEIKKAFEKCIVVPLYRETDNHKVQDHKGMEVLPYAHPPKNVHNLLAFAFFLIKHRNEIGNEIKYQKKCGIKNRALFRQLKECLWEAYGASQHYEMLKSKFALKDYKTVIYSYWTLNNMIFHALSKNENNTTLISRFHSLDIYHERSSFGYLPFRKLLLEKLDALLFISDFGRQYFVNSYLPSEQQLGKIHLAKIGLPDFSGNSPKNISEKDEFILLSNSWIFPNKRLELIINALAEIKHLPIHWMHIGDAWNQPEYMQQLEVMANNKLSGGKIRYTFLGRKENQDVIDIYRKYPVQLFINTSKSEGIPVSMMEAMCFSVPVLGTHVGGVHEIVKPGENGELLPPDPTPSEVAHSLTFFYELPAEKKEAYRNAARATFLKDYFVDANNRRLLSIIEALR